MIHVLTATDSRYPVNRPIIKKAVLETLERAGLALLTIEVSVAVVGRRKMKALGDKYLGDGRVHEVLSFPLEEVSSGKGGFVNTGDGVLRLGDVILCWPEVLLVAAEDNVMIDEEIYNLTSHGVEHLLGKHHE